MSQKLFIGGIAFSTTSQGLRDFFSPAGTVVSANLVTDPDTGRSRGFGFVEMATSEEADQAVTQLNGRELDGRRLRVEISKPKATGSGRGGFGGGHAGSRW
jgi:RNA recognition motif-containing protein